jgi:hypothetical protein
MAASDINRRDHYAGDVEFDNLCDLCMDMFNDKATWNPKNYPEKETDYHAHHDIRALASSAEENCHLCSLILERISPADIERLQKDIDESPVYSSQQIWIRIRLYGSRYELEISVMLQDTDAFGGGGQSSCQIRPSKIASLRILPEESDYIFDMRSKSTLNCPSSMFIRIAQWMELCLRSHSKCFDIQTMTATRDILPTRLLDLTPVSHGDFIRLISSESLPIDTIYATLSHCWGGRCRVTLTKDRLAVFQTGLLTAALPRTFRDAVLVTRKLGIRYLWIDSLCIIQDSDQDWSREASLMGDIYANSYITIAATASPESEGGLFYSRSPLSVWPCRVEATWDCFAAGNLLAGAQGWSEERHMEPLGHRGWAFQEWLLSKRIIHFCKDQIRWECFCMAASEAYTAGLEEEDLEYHGTHTKSLITFFMEDAEPEYLWRRIRQEYSEKHLTVGTDRLAAFSGIARMIYKAVKYTKEDYLAGLWRPKLLEELLWERYPEKDYKCQTTPYIAPSWSWASLDGPFWYSNRSHFRSYNIHATILDAKTIPEDDDFGPVKGGFLVIKCTICYVVVISPSKYPSGPEDPWKFVSINGASVAYPCSIKFDHAPNFTSSTEHSFSFMPIQSSERTNSKEGTDFSGLLIGMTTAGHGQYYRLGLMEIWCSEKEAVLSPPVGQTFLDYSSYKDLSSDGLYTIELV